MNVKLSAEQRQALDQCGSPVMVEDEQTKRIYLLIEQSMLEALREHSDMAAILEGIADAEAGRLQPADEAFREMRVNLRKRFANDPLSSADSSGSEANGGPHPLAGRESVS